MTEEQSRGQERKISKYAPGGVLPAGGAADTLRGGLGSRARWHGTGPPSSSSAAAWMPGRPPFPGDGSGRHLRTPLGRRTGRGGARRSGRRRGEAAEAGGAAEKRGDDTCGSGNETRTGVGNGNGAARRAKVTDDEGGNKFEGRHGAEEGKRNCGGER